MLRHQQKAAAGMWFVKPFLCFDYVLQKVVIWLAGKEAGRLKGEDHRGNTEGVASAAGRARASGNEMYIQEEAQRAKYRRSVGAAQSPAESVML